MPARFSCLLALVLPSIAHAGFPEDVSLSGMTQQGGVLVADPGTLSGSYATLIRQLGAAIDSHTILPARTLGASGFEMVVDTSFSFTDTSNNDGTPSTFERASVNESPSPFLFAPGVTLRKGLPLSLELGTTARWIGMSRQGIFGAFVHAGLLENYEPWPDIGLHLGYTGYVGNNELALGVFDAGLSLGGSFRPGKKDKLHAAEISPYLDASLQIVSATPTLDAATIASIGAVTYGKRGGNVDGNPDQPPNQSAITMPRFAVGLQIKAAHLVIRASGSVSLTGTKPDVSPAVATKAMAGAAVAIGYTY